MTARRIHPGMGAPGFDRLRLKSVAKRQGISVSQISQISGMSWERIRSYWLGYSRPTHQAMLALAKALETDTVEFYEVTPCTTV